MTMLPSKQEWSAWSALEKIGYVAQITAPLTLLVTVLSLLATVSFSFYSWRESARAAELQKELFVAQNSPDISLEAVAVSQPTTDPLIVLTLKNVGESVAHSLCVFVFVPPRTKISHSCDKGSPFEHAFLPKAQEFEYPIIVRGELVPVLGFAPTSGKVLRLADTDRSCPDNNIGLVTVAETFNDALGGEHARLFALLLCGSEMPKGKTRPPVQKAH